MTRRLLFKLFPQAAAVAPPLSVVSIELFKRDYESNMGAVDGTNKTFNLTYTPNGPARLSVYLNGLLMRNGGDYTLNGKTVTFTTAPSAGSLITADAYCVFSV